MKVYVLKRVLVADGFVEINETRVFADEKKAKETFKEKKEQEIKEATDSDWDYNASDDSEIFFETYGEHYAANHFNLSLTECELE